MTARSSTGGMVRSAVVTKEKVAAAQIREAGKSARGHAAPFMTPPPMSDDCTGLLDQYAYT